MNHKIQTFLLAALSPVVALADGVIRYVDIAQDENSGIRFRHTEPPRNAILEQLRQDGFQIPDSLTLQPHKPHGAPGVAIFDFDGDGDLDIYATNSLDGANSLYANQWIESGEVRFVDKASEAGVEAVDQDSTGTCFGDIDNDGDHDLMVLGAIGPNRLYENRGDGTFKDITATAGVGVGDLSTSSCSMGDVNNDGLLDIAVANTHTSWNDYRGIFIPFAFNEHNQLFLNAGGNTFDDVSADAGFETLAGLPPEFAGSAGLTWALALVDYDQDGDVDLLSFDDQGGVPHPPAGVPYGFIHLHRNDGTGHFTDIASEAGLVQPGNWMGVAFGDLNCDDHMDFFATNVGDYPGGLGPTTNPLGLLSSKWFLGQADGTFVDPGLGELQGTTFGWGAAIYDVDNDGDSDITYVGADDFALFVEAGNPGTILRNQGCKATPEFVYDPALALSADHVRRVDNGLAVGDLNHDGFLDVVTTSNSNLPASVPLFPRAELGLAFDPAMVAPMFAPSADDPSLFTWLGHRVEDGSLTVEMSSADNGNNWAAVTLRGMAGTVAGGRVNRDGIGAVFRVRTAGGKKQMIPILGGASFASQSSLTANFGLGREESATVDVLWPGGIRNQLRDVRHGEHLLFPEIPCDYDRQFEDLGAYQACVDQALAELVAAGVLTQAESARFATSALACEAGPTTLCLQNGLYEVEIDWWTDPSHVRPGQIVAAGSVDAGLFSFFNPEIVEIHVNAISGCAVNGYEWVFGAASTNVGYELRVTHVPTGAMKTYSNTAGELATPIADTTAFPCSP